MTDSESEVELEDLHNDNIDERETLIHSSSTKFSNTFLSYILEKSFWTKYIHVTIKQTKRSKGSFCVGFISSMVLMIIVSLLFTISDNSPIAFLKIAEMETAEIDLEITPRLVVPSDVAPLLNFTKIESLLSNHNMYLYNSPRFQQTSVLYSSNECNTSSLDPFDPEWKYVGISNATDDNPECANDIDGCFLFYCGSMTPFQAELTLIDSKREKSMELGREWIKNYREKEIDTGTAYIRNKLAKSMGVSVGDVIYIKLNGTSFFQGMWKLFITDRLEASLLPSNNFELVYLPVKISGIFDGYQGKISDYSKSAIIMEYGAFMPHFVKHVNSQLSDDIKQSLSNINLYEYAGSVVWNLPPERRLKTYIQTNSQRIHDDLVQFFSNLLFIIGIVDIDTELVVLGSLIQTEILGLFLGLMSYVVLLILTILSILLLHSLVTIRVESMMFDWGVLKSMGISNMKLTYIIILYSFSFTIPAWIIGLIVSQIVCDIFVEVLSGITFMSLSPLLSTQAILISTCIIFIIPILSSVLPTRNILNQSILAALDRYHPKAVAVEFSVERSEKFSNPNYRSYLLLGSFLMIFGIAIYYLLPYSLLSQDYGTFLFIMVFILAGLLLGLVLLSLNLVHFTTNFLTYLFFWEHENMRKLLRKNLLAHRKRNRNTSGIFAMALGFVYFAMMTYQLQIDTFMFDQARGIGTYLKVSTRQGKSIPWESVPAFESICEENNNIDACAWTSRPLLGTWSTVSSVGHMFQTVVEIWAVSPNFYDVTTSEFLRIGEPTKSRYPHTTGNSLLHDLYTVEGSHGAILGTSIGDALGLQEENSHFLIRDPTQKRRLKPVGFLDTSPYFFFSKYPDTTASVLVESSSSGPNAPTYIQDSLVSFPTFIRLSSGTYSSIEDVPLGSMFIKFKKGITNDEMDHIKDQLEGVIGSLQLENIYVSDYRSNTVRARLNQTISTYFMGLTVTIAMVICYFSLMASMFSNIMDQTKEIGILRVIGLEKIGLYRLYLYEGFLIVFSASLFGLLIGSFIGWTMQIQQSLWQQLPLPFSFPFGTFLWVSMLSLLFGFLSTYFPLKRILQQPLPSVLR